MQVRWHDIPFPWGPVGSAGFELANNYPATNEESDLDLIIRASEPIAKETARRLRDLTLGLGVRVDVLVETPDCGFSLEEYACGSTSQILLRQSSGPRLGDDPWSKLMPNCDRWRAQLKCSSGSASNEEWPVGRPLSGDL